MDSTATLPGEELVSDALLKLSTGRLDDIQNTLTELSPAEVANLLEAMPPEPRAALWEALPTEREAEILPRLHDDARAGIIDLMDGDALLAAAQGMAAGDLAGVFDELPQDLTDTILDSLDADNRARVESVLAFEERTAGRIMDKDVLSVRPTATLGVVLRWLRRHEKLPPHTDSLMVVNDKGIYLGKLPLDSIVTGAADAPVAQIMVTDAPAVNASATDHEVAALFDRRELISVAVVDDESRLLGRITFGHASNVIREEAAHALLKSAGLRQEEDLFAPIIPSAQRRGLWLGINLLTVFLAAWVIGQFEAALSQLVALAVLMPVVASMGGIAGSQTLTLTIRGMALDQIVTGNIRWLTVKELAVGALNGSVWALVVAVVTFLWFGNIGLSVVIAVAMMLNLVAASLCGVGVPLILKRMGIDPALSGAVILTTVTDIVGFLSFLGLATVFLL